MGAVRADDGAVPGSMYEWILSLERQNCRDSGVVCDNPKKPFMRQRRSMRYLTGTSSVLQSCSYIFRRYRFLQRVASQFVRLYGANDQVELQIPPGITTVQAMAARLGTNWQDVELCSIHGRSRNIMNELRRHARVFLPGVSKAEDMRRISQQLIDYGYHGMHRCQ